MPKNDTQAKSIEDRIKQAESEFSECQNEVEQVKKANGISWDQREALFYGQYISIDKDGTITVDRNSTGELTTSGIDRASRIMAQLPSGRFENYSEDTGKNILMNLLFEHYVIPYARTGGPMKTRLRMVDLYSDLYTIPVLVEWMKTDLYTGPDFTILDPRRFFPQAGKAAIEDMDYCFVETFPSKAWLESLDEEYFKNKKEILECAEEVEIDKKSLAYYDRGSKTKGVRIRHKLSRNGDWLAYLPDVKNGSDKSVLIDEKEYYPRIPIVLKQQYQRIGSIWSYTNFERGYSTQEKIDRLNEMGLRAVEMMIDPPLIMDPANVIVSSIKRQKGANWFAKDGRVNDVKPVPVAPQALGAYQSQMQMLKSNIMNMSATTDTSVSKDVDPGFGKSPEALKQQGARMGARDSWDEDMMEIFVEDLFSLMADLLASKGVDPYSFSLLSGAIKQIKEDYPEEAKEIEAFIKDGKMNIPVDQVKGKYRYIIEPGSMLIKKDDVADRMLSAMKIYAENPGIKEDLAASDQKLDLGVAFKAILKEAGSKWADKIIVPVEPPKEEGAESEEESEEAPEAGLEGGMPSSPEQALAIATQALDKTQVQ